MTDSDYFDYEREPAEIIEETTWVVHDPWLAQDVGVFSSRPAAELFLREWMCR